MDDVVGRYQDTYECYPLATLQVLTRVYLRSSEAPSDAGLDSLSVSKGGQWGLTAGTDGRPPPSFFFFYYY